MFVRLFDHIRRWSLSVESAEVHLLDPLPHADGVPDDGMAQGANGPLVMGLRRGVFCLRY
jgi:hypothetical protein